jgi:hypothetical protein
MASSAGGASKKDSYVRADKIDLESLDLQLGKQLAKTWEKRTGRSQGPREVWEIDLAKLDIRYVIAQGTYGTVYRGTYDGQDVAGILLSESLFCSSHTVCSASGLLAFCGLSFPVPSIMVFSVRKKKV